MTKCRKKSRQRRVLAVIAPDAIKNKQPGFIHPLMPVYVHSRFHTCFGATEPRWRTQTIWRYKKQCFPVALKADHAVQRAIELVKLAIIEDEKHNYADAYKIYQNALDYFMLACKCKPTLTI